MNCGIIGTGKIGIDLYYKLKKNKKNNIFIVNLNPKSKGARYCKSKKFNYSSGGLKSILKKNVK